MPRFAPRFSVALRCGLLEPGRATLWAGAGIVSGSQPDAEYDETTTKMQAMLRSLEGAQDAVSVGAGDAPRRDEAVA